MITGPLGFYKVLRLLVFQVLSELPSSLGGVPERSCVVPGAIAWDECECGQLAATVEQTYLTDNFPQQRTVSTPCRASLIASDCLISILRCAPQPEGNSLAPTCDVLDEAAQIMASDAYIVLNTVACTLNDFVDENKIVDYVLGTQLPRGPSGSCTGTDLAFSVALNRI